MTFYLPIPGLVPLDPAVYTERIFLSLCSSLYFSKNLSSTLGPKGSLFRKSSSFLNTLFLPFVMRCFMYTSYHKIESTVNRLVKGKSKEMFTLMMTYDVDI